jgi:hypothetical protein
MEPRPGGGWSVDCRRERDAVRLSARFARSAAAETSENSSACWMAPVCVQNLNLEFEI